MQFSSPGSSKMKIFETDFFDTRTIQNDQISHVKHVLAPLCVFFPAATAAARHGQHGRDLVPSGSSLLAAVQAQAGGLGRPRPPEL